MMITKRYEHAEEEEEEEGDNAAVKYALTQINALLQLSPNDEDQTLDGILDEKAKLVLERLLDCATEHAVKSHLEVTAESVTPTMEQINSQRHLTSKEVPKLPCTSSNKIWTRSPGDLSKSPDDLNCGSITSYSKKLCQMHEKNSFERLDSLKEVTSSHDKTLSYNDMAIKHIRSIMSLDATNSQALWFNAQSGDIPSDHVERNLFDTTLGSPNCSLAKASERENATKPLDHEILPQTIADPIKETKRVGMHHRPGIEELIQDMKVEDLQYSGPIQRQRGIPSISARWNGGHSKIKNLAVQKSCISRNKSLSQSHMERTRMLGQTKVMDQRQNPGTVLTTTLGPTLLRTASAHLHFRKDKLNQVDENHELWDSDQRSIRTGKKISTSKGQSRQMISLPTLPGEGRFRKTRRRSHDSHRKRTGDEKNAHLASPIRHLPPRQMSMARTTSISTSASSDPTWTGTETSPTDSEDSVPRRTMTRRSVNPTSSYLSSRGSIRPSKRMSHYTMVAPPLQAVPMTHTRNTKKQTGRLQRIKNKLGLIFHHHHHHHHHHHNDEGEAGVSHAALSNPNHSFWKSLRNMLQRTSKDAQRKDRRHVGPHQREAEHGIINGLMRHVWSSKKKSKRSGDIKRLRKMQSRQVVKKWHWWQRFHKRRGVVRQSSIRKPNVKWGFKARKPQLRALKHH